MDTQSLTPEPGVVTEPCPRCHGSGRIKLVINDEPRSKIICCWCGGKGQKNSFAPLKNPD